MTAVTVVRGGVRVVTARVTGGAAVRVAAVGVQGPPGPAVPKGVAMEWPVNGDEATLFWTPYALTVASVHAVVRGTAPGVTFRLMFGPDRDGVGTVIADADVTATGPGEDVVLGTADVPADSYVWLVIDGVAGTVREFHLTTWF